jgi:CysZ protein
MRQMTDAAGYLVRASKLARQRELLPWVLIPLAFNTLLFGTAYYFAGTWINDWIEAATAGLNFDWDWVNSLLEAVIGFAQILVWILLLALFASFFTMAVQLIAAPFMGFLAEKVDFHVTGDPLPEEGIPAMVVRMFRREIRKTWYWLWRAVLMLIGVGILSLIPVVNVAAPVIWFLWSGWLMGMQYLDFGADNRQVSFPGMLAAMRRQRWLVLTFGCLVLGLTMLPLVNLVIMPLAVIAGTLIWAERLAEGVA